MSVCARITLKVFNTILQLRPPFPGSEPLPPPGPAFAFFAALLVLGLIVVVAMHVLPSARGKIGRIVKACAFHFRRR
jgi:hypothetical protein